MMRGHHIVRTRAFGFNPIVVGMYPHGRQGRRLARARARELNLSETGKTRGPYISGLLREREPYVDIFTKEQLIHGKDGEHGMLQ